MEKPASNADMQCAERQARRGGLVTASSTSRKHTVYCLCVAGKVSWVRCEVLDGVMFIETVSQEVAKRILRS
ncbi:hypothetical protein B0G71_4356 [Paraburkholderia sp. BL27I4N3]|nr:hypothetical protein B0G71_4356 [Paraburkholderia sp. BL27I4N3]